MTFDVLYSKQKHFWDLVQSGKWEPYTFKFLKEMLSYDKFYIDVGAWIGPTSIYASKLCKDGIAIEPDPVAYVDLEINLKLNSISNMVSKKIAISNYNGYITLGSDGGLGKSVTRRNQKKNTFEVECFTLTEFTNFLSIEKVDVIKIDVEGEEKFILQDKPFFKKYKPIIHLSLHPHLVDNKNELLEIVKGMGEIYSNVYDCNMRKIHLDHIIPPVIIFS